MIYSIENIKEVIISCSNSAIYFKPMLTLLDNYSGDGDMGITIEKGSKAVIAAISNTKFRTVGELFGTAGRAFNKAASSTIGTLIYSAFYILENKFSDKTELPTEEAILIPSYMADAIAMCGHAKLGDKTILDSLIPFSDTLKEQFYKTGDVRIAGIEASRVAKEAAKSTRGMIATIGRAKWIGERSRDYPDPGAVLCSVIVESIFRSDTKLGYKLPEYES